MRVVTPLRRSHLEHDRDLEQRVADLEALIEEARRRARRRRRVYAALALGVLEPPPGQLSASAAVRSIGPIRRRPVACLGCASEPGAVAPGARSRGR